MSPMRAVEVIKYPSGVMSVYRYVAQCLVEEIKPTGAKWRRGYDALLRVRSDREPRRRAELLRLRQGGEQGPRDVLRRHHHRVRVRRREPLRPRDPLRRDLAAHHPRRRGAHSHARALERRAGAIRLRQGRGAGARVERAVRGELRARRQRAGRPRGAGVRRLEVRRRLHPGRRRLRRRPCLLHGLGRLRQAAHRRRPPPRGRGQGRGGRGPRVSVRRARNRESPGAARESSPASSRRATFTGGR